jgi:SAM-dependent methyltransferase
MDLRLLARIETLDWAGASGVLDLACGIGRIGVRLRAQGVQRLDGLDFAPEMRARAEAKGSYGRPIPVDMLATGLPAATYDLALEVLADEHLAELGPLYREAACLAAPAACSSSSAIIRFLMNGIASHFGERDDEPVASRAPRSSRADPPWHGPPE